MRTEYCISLVLLVVCLNAVRATDLSVGERAFIDCLGRDDCIVVNLWPDGTAPNESHPGQVEALEKEGSGGVTFTSVVTPSMVIIPPPQGKRSTGVTLVLCPGGGYGVLAMKSIVQSARWLNDMGATAVLLKYRVPPRPEDRDNRHLPLSDAQRAMSLLRSKAKEWHLDPAKIGIGGFSAGGHLAFNLACHSDERVYESVDDHDKTACRPDFVVLYYPAYLTEPIDSLDANPNLELDKIASKNLPPVFSAITRPDGLMVGCVNTVWSLKEAKVPFELHVYPTGGHSASYKYPLMELHRPLARFLKDHAILDEEAQTAGDRHIDRLVPEVRKAELERVFKGKVPKREPAPKGEAIKGVPEDRLTLGDREIMKYAEGTYPVLPLWPGDGTRDDDPMKPGDERLDSNRGEILRVTDVTKPTMMLMKPTQPDGRAMLVFPGGGYGILAANHEGTDIARWLNSQGITVFVVKYRVPRRKGIEKHVVALQDAQRAIRLVRSQADKFGIHPNRIGVLGFSAGGHLSVLTCLQHDNPSYEPVDEHDKVSCRPDFGCLIYPAYLRDEDTMDPLVSAPTLGHSPPMYIAIAADDRFMEGASHFLLKAYQGKVPVEFHVYEKGGHGQGLRKSGYPFSEWTKSCERWLDDVADGIATE